MSLINFRYGTEFTSLRAAKGSHFIPEHVAEFFSDISLEVLREFGWETPKLLNEYSCALEDALIELQRENTKLRGSVALAEMQVEGLRAKKSKGKKKSKRFNKKNKA